MKIANHICFFYSEQTTSRVEYVNKIILETNKYVYQTDIFIHTNVEWSKDLLCAYDNGTITVIVHDLSNENPFYLSWKCRPLLLTQVDDYDIFMYIEDDMLVPTESINYWLKYKDMLLEQNYNLGFIRIEVNTEGVEYCTDVQFALKNSICINDQLFINNDNCSYCAFWIYDKKEFIKWTNSHYYNPENIPFYSNLLREKSAYGLHKLDMVWYKATVIPIENNRLADECKIYHLPNNYANKITWSSFLATLPYKDVISL